MAVKQLFMFINIAYIIHVAISANPDGSCTNPKFRWFKDLDAFYNYAESVNATNGNGNNTKPAIRINISMDTAARCLDGSQYFFYFRSGFGDGLKKYQIYLQGGGWCTSYKECSERAQNNGYLGSSQGYTQYAWYSADYLDDSQINNPLMYNWNTIWMIYCDGSSFTGNNFTIYRYGEQNLYFRGHQNLKEGMLALQTEYGLDKASDIVLSGCSAGGLAVYLNNDYIVNNFVNQEAAKTFLSISASGFFPFDNPINANDKNWANGILWIYDTQNVTNNLNAQCVAHYKQMNAASNCMFAQFVVPFLHKNKIFALQSIYDAAGMSEQGINANDASESNEYGQFFAELFIESFIESDNALHAALLYSCYSHCGEYNQINASNVLSANGIQMFFNDELTQNLIFQNYSYRCNECCFADYIVPPPDNISVCTHSNELCNPMCN